MKSTFQTASKTIFITGASRGIGKATAKLFQKKGWNVVATMRSPEKEAELIELDNVLVERLDVTKPDTIKSAIENSLKRFGSIEVLVNNAGYGAFVALEAFSEDRIERQFNTNVIGLLSVTKAIIPLFRAQRSGIIVNMSSVGGHVTLPLGTLYHGTKYAVEGLSEALTFELAPLGVRIKLIEPGVIKSDFLSDHSFDFAEEGSSIPEYEEIGKKFTATMAQLSNQGADPSLVAESVWESVHDDSDTMRYLVGDDAKEFMRQRAEHDDASFLAYISGAFGL